MQIHCSKIVNIFLNNKQKGYSKTTSHNSIKQHIDTYRQHKTDCKANTSSKKGLERQSRSAD